MEQTIEEIYQKKTHHEHILHSPDTYIGSVEKDLANLWVYDDDTNKMEKKDIEFVPGLYKIFDEILVNTRDQTIRCSNCKTIKVNIDKAKGEIMVWNDGDGIDVVKHKEHKIYIPELIFGNLLSSTNYDKSAKKIVGGKNGYGAKLANIYSTKFVVETVDAKRKLKYVQKFKNNMYSIGKPKVKEYDGEPYTKITFYPDFEKFGLLNLSDDIISLMKKRVYDVAACTQNNVKVYLNKKLIKINTFEKYIDYFYDDEFDLKKKKVYIEVNNRWRIGVVFNPENGYEHVSYVNGICTYKGGKHVDYIVNQLVKSVGELVLKKHKTLKLKPSQIKDNITVFINSVIVNPAFSSQTKEELTSKRDTFGSECKLDKKFFEKLGKTGLIDELVEFGKLKEQSILKKTDGKKTSRLQKIDKLEDANKAGTRQSQKCSLILTEGDSAKALAVAGLSVIGRDYYGVFPLKGKLLNVREATPAQMLKNTEICNLKKIMGLQHGKKYEDIKQLRYGRIIIFTDQDVDGSHIKGLLINFIHYFWPELIKMDGFIACLTTPVVKVTKGKKVKNFYNLSEYNKWVGKGLKGWTTKYYKGLGTSTAKEAREYFNNIDNKLIHYCNNDDALIDIDIDEEDIKTETDTALELAFHSKKSNDRKKWLSTYSEDQFLNNDDKKISYHDFVHKELIHFSKDDNDRSLPCMIDGFKPSQRKIYFVTDLKGLHNQKKEIKVAQLAGAVSEKACYHHGEASLCGAIVNMAQNYVGSNNINVLSPNGQFGTRLAGGKDAASPRYLFTRFTKIAQYIFREDDFPILDRVYDDGQIVEPTWYCPIIPMVLVNGSDGIGTGFSTKVPSFNPLDIVKNIYRLMDGNKMKTMRPWYRNYKGHILNLGDGKYEVRGEFSVLDNRTVEITELPIGTWTSNYKAFLDDSIIGTHTDAKGRKKEFLEDVENYCSEVSIRFVLKFPEDELIKYIDKGTLENKLKLIKTISTTNMHLHTADGLQIKKYKKPKYIIKDFYDVRLNCYNKRKNYLLNKYRKELEYISWKRKFIKYVINKKIIVFKQKRKTIEEKLGEFEFPKMGEKQSYDYLLDIRLSKFTQEELDKLDGNYDAKELELKVLEGKDEVQLWKEELDEFLKEYKKWDKEQTKEFELNSAKKK